jgi:hypothetical protein
MSNERLLLSGLVIIGAVTIGIVRKRDQEKKVLWSLRADLHNMATAQEAYYFDHGTYGLDVANNGWRSWHGSSVELRSADSMTWSATATHPGTHKTCTSSGTRGKQWDVPVCK